MNSQNHSLYFQDTEPQSLFPEDWDGPAIEHAGFLTNQMTSNIRKGDESGHQNIAPSHTFVDYSLPEKSSPSFKSSLTGPAQSDDNQSKERAKLIVSFQKDLLLDNEQMEKVIMEGATEVQRKAWKERLTADQIAAAKNLHLKADVTTIGHLRRVFKTRLNSLNARTRKARTLKSAEETIQEQEHVIKKQQHEIDRLNTLVESHERNNERLHAEIGELHALLRKYDITLDPATPKESEFFNQAFSLNA